MKFVTAEYEKQWNDILDGSEKATIYHTLDWQDLIHQVYGFQPCYLMNDYKPHFALTTGFLVKSVLSGRKFTNMPYNFYSEPIYDLNESCRDMLSYLLSYCKKRGINCIELKSLCPLDSQLVSDFEMYESKPFVNSTLLLEDVDDYSTYNKSLSKNFRQNLRTYGNKTTREGIEIKTCDSLEELKASYDVLCKMYRDKHMMVCHPYSLYEFFFKNLIPKGKAQILIAKKDDKILAGIVALMYNSKVHYCWAANSLESYRFGLNYLLIEELVKRTINLGYKSIDFGSSPPLDENLLYFKERWGCIHQPVYYYYLLKHQTQPDYNTSFGNLRKLYRYVPLGIIKQLMPFVVRQLA